MSELSHLDQLEAEAIYIIREVAASCEKPVMLYSIGKDSSVMLHLALKAFYPDKKVVFLTGMMQDKDTDRMLEEMVPLAQEFVCIHPDSQRAMDQNDMCRMLRERYGVQATACQTVNEGIRTAIKKAGDHAVVCALGSLYLAGEIQSFFEKGEQCR